MTNLHPYSHHTRRADRSYGLGINMLILAHVLIIRSLRQYTNISCGTVGRTIGTTVCEYVTHRLAPPEMQLHVVVASRLILKPAEAYVSASFLRAG
jgi:hypothetical protein